MDGIRNYGYKNALTLPPVPFSFPHSLSFLEIELVARPIRNLQGNAQHSPKMIFCVHYVYRQQSCTISIQHLSINLIDIDLSDAFCRLPSPPPFRSFFPSSICVSHVLRYGHTSKSRPAPPQTGGRGREGDDGGGGGRPCDDERCRPPAGLSSKLRRG